MAKKISAAEVAKHTSKDDLWLIIDGEVFNVTEWAPDHPGGPKVIAGQAGKDASKQFAKFHPDWVRTKLFPKYKIGEVEEQAKL